MLMQTTKTKLGRQGNVNVELPAKFTPRFWDQADGRCMIVKEICRRYELLKRETGADSYQKALLCQRATFLAVQLETMEARAAEGGMFEPGVYSNLTNSLIGLLKALGLESHGQKPPSLRAYVEAGGQQ